MCPLRPWAQSLQLIPKGEAGQEQRIWSVTFEQDLVYSEVKGSGQYTLAVTLTHGHELKVRFQEGKDTNELILSH